MTNDANTSVPHQRSLRFSLRTLLLLAMMIALCLSAFQYGRQVGFAEGDQSGFVAGLVAKTYVVMYPISNLVISEGTEAELADCQLLIDEIVAQVQPQSWEQAGGPGEIAYDPSRKSLIVYQSERGHDAIVEFLEPKRFPRGETQQAIRVEQAAP